MGQVSQRPEFVLESVERRGVQPQDGFERHPLVALAVECLIHHAHAARAQTPPDREPLRARECVNWVRFQRT